jgi:hypothetical protein
MNFEAFDTFRDPFPHWVANRFLPMSQVKEINAQWPGEGFPGWRIENGRKSKKASLLFPARLPEAADSLAEAMMSPATLQVLSEMTGMELLPDPWFREGPTVPRLGGGLHEIHVNGLLGMHLDFSEHPTKLTRCLNLLIYLNEEWKSSWGGALELHDPNGGSKKTIYPTGGTAVMFRTTDQSWHGHPHPLVCPPHKTRRSLALYYYKWDSDRSTRPTTVYR